MSMMTKKDYKLIANCIKKVNTFENEYNKYLISKSELVTRLIIALKEDNPRFNAEKFREACYV